MHPGFSGVCMDGCRDSMPGAPWPPETSVARRVVWQVGGVALIEEGYQIDQLPDGHGRGQVEHEGLRFRLLRRVEQLAVALLHDMTRIGDGRNEIGIAADESNLGGQGQIEALAQFRMLDRRPFDGVTMGCSADRQTP